MGRKRKLKLERAQRAAEAKKNDIPAPFWAQTWVTVFGALLIVSSIFHIGKLIEECSLYVSIYSYLSPDWIVVRYAFSWFQRLVGILVGLGIIVRKELARKLGIAVGLFTILTIYWKHPYPAVLLHNQHLDEKIGHWLTLTGTGVTFASVTPFSVAGLFASDIVFWAIFFYFFTRPPVKIQFKQNL